MESRNSSDVRLLFLSLSRVKLLSPFDGVREREREGEGLRLVGGSGSSHVFRTRSTRDVEDIRFVCCSVCAHSKIVTRLPLVGETELIRQSP